MGERVSDDRTLVGKRILQITTVDATIRAFLTPLIDALEADGAVVESAARCRSREYLLRQRGYVVHCIPFARRVVTPIHLLTLWRLWWLMRGGRYDAVHVHTPVAGILGRLAARWARVPVVIYTAHGFYFHDRMRWLPRQVYVAIEKILGRTCTDFLFTVSPEDARTAHDARIVADGKLHCLESMGVDLERFHPAPDLGGGSRAEDASGIPVAVLVGRIVREKGIFDLIWAIKHLKDKGTKVRWLIVGGTVASGRAWGVKADIRRLIDRLDLAEDIRFLGFRQDIPEILRSADMLVLPSHREGMPITILEAMASGKPVVATDIRGCREEVVNEVTGLIVPPKDPTALAEAIERLVHDPEMARRMGRAGRERAMKYDSMRVVAEQVAAYRKLLSR